MAVESTVAGSDSLVMAFWNKFAQSFERPAPDVGEILKRALPEPLRFPQFYITHDVCIHGNLEAAAHGHVDGTVEGTIKLGDRTLTIGRKGRVIGEVRAATVVVRGNLKGDVYAAEAVEIAAGASVEGNVEAPRFVLAEGADFKGEVNRAPLGRPHSRPLLYAVRLEGAKVSGGQPLSPTP